MAWSRIDDHDLRRNIKTALSLANNSIIVLNNTKVIDLK